METPKNNSGNPGWNDIIFEGRNKSYGAYALRRDYDKRAILGFMFSAGLLVLITGAGTIRGWLGLQDLSEVITDTWKEPRVLTDVVLEIEKPELPGSKEKSETPPAGDDKPRTDETPLFVTTDSIETIQDIEEDTAGFSSPGTTGGKGPEGPGTPGTPAGGEGGAGTGDGSGSGLVIHDIPEEMPTFPGGEEALFKYLKRNLKYPKGALSEGREAIVYVAFVVLPDGSIGDIAMKNHNGFGFEEEVIRVVKNMPDWNAGKVDSKPVAVRFNMPVRFTLGR